MTKEQLIDTCMKLRPSEQSWRYEVERLVDYFDGYADFDFRKWKYGVFVEARGIVGAMLEKMAKYNLNGFSGERTNRKVKKIAKLMRNIL